MEFKVDSIYLKTFKSNPDQFEVILGTGKYEWDKIKDIPTMPQGVYRVVIEPVVEE